MSLPDAAPAPGGPLAEPVAGCAEFREPAYADRSLGDVLPAVARALGVDAGLPRISDDGLVLPGASSYVVFLVDGLGYELLRDHPEEAPFLHAHLGEPATVGVPSTTATSLTSFGTALPPGAHGVVGFSSRIPGTDQLLNALMWSKDVDPREWQPHTTAFSRLAAAGVRTTVVNKRSFEGSGLTVAGHRGADFVGVDRVGERIAAVQAVSATSPSVTYMYDGDLDWTGHRYGVDSPEWEQQLVMIDAAAEHLRETLPDQTRILVVADHGMVDSPMDNRLDVAEEPELAEGVVLLGGEARFRHVYCRSGAVDDVVATWSERIGDLAVVLTRDEAIGRGWFGPVAPAVRPRLGDVVVACRGDFAVVSTELFPYEARLVGLHGSLTPAEMLIPVLVL
ncbi:alkaline phosphatase family protein [Nocardioides mesophilus]|uniref:Alkaline phosphatase family protein n=1 Tax=Nocardioides mesophilus TaxID=433659 RepID=A0A7G9RBM1_9ACTN|nr:nucleotide pyrophosphatase/phosphodiesterase family protein [Nocardioides mesophilus]QNN52996.1 alkaline phosphatase family protein [Nocardioides mesophilus]